MVRVAPFFDSRCIKNCP